MAPRTKTEKLLLVVLAVILFTVGNFYGYEWLSEKQSRLQRTYAEMRADQAEAKVDLQQADLWTQRREWIRTHEPVLGSEGETKAQVLEYVLKGARDNQLEVIEQGLVDKIERGPAGAEVGVTLKVKGSMQGLVRWLTSLEAPNEFYAVSSFSLNLDQDQKSFVCSLQVARYFREGS